MCINAGINFSPMQFSSNALSITVNLPPAGQRILHGHDGQRGSSFCGRRSLLGQLASGWQAVPGPALHPAPRSLQTAPQRHPAWAAGPNGQTRQRQADTQCAANATNSTSHMSNSRPVVQLYPAYEIMCYYPNRTISVCPSICAYGWNIFTRFQLFPSELK